MSSEPPRYRVIVADNARYMERAAHVPLADFDSLPDALRAARSIVDDELARLYRPGMATPELLRLYSLFGGEPFIVPSDPRQPFRAWEYARQRAHQLCQREEPPAPSAPGGERG